LRNELTILFPAIKWYTLSQTVDVSPDSSRRDTIVYLQLALKNHFPRAEKFKLASWLKQRIPSDSVKLLIE
jgi:hypothetical protein